MFPQQTEEFSIATPVQSEVNKIVLAQQEVLQAEADAERVRLANEELRLKTIAKSIQKKSEIDALHIAVAEHRFQEEEFRADTEYRAAESRIRSTEVSLQEEADKARDIVRAEEATQRFRALEIERQHEYNINEQRIRDDSVARNMQQRLIELEHQSRATAEDLVNLSELKQREKALQEECAYKERLRTQFEEEKKRVRALAESVVVEKENKMQIAFDEKYQSQFNVTQAELANQFALFQNKCEKMKQDWRNFTNSKDKEIEILKLKLLDAQKALEKVSRPGSSNDVPAGSAGVGHRHHNEGYYRDY